jgi:uncharacterized OB-fold protein
MTYIVQDQGTIDQITRKLKLNRICGSRACACGRTISANKTQCLACSKRPEKGGEI